MRGNYDNMLLESVTGEILYEITNDQLIQMGYLTPPKIRIIEVPGKTVVKRPKKTRGAGDYWRLVSDACIISHVKRNELIAKEIMKGNGPMLCLVSTITQAHNIQAAIRKLGGAVPTLLTGKDKTETRRQAVRDLRSGKERAILCTTIFDEGVDIPELKEIILASGGKSQVKLLQRIGRGLRLAEGKSSVRIVDFADRHHDMVRKHALERMKRYREEGFEVIK
jgi:superfamily II DNA or RNA helicase